ncbi:hypothetical protein SEA_ROSIEPOSIE_78 [Arthrobacter phage RosiePosie]|uniref:Uncharacterized protein n=1 Tax=Arthrobacter phage RosiePosie TaxID=2015836 RepID=A0A286N3L6_9CAUD|nr:hypothetical protein SEA_ROSIEPOSIE_78 [Arthrobacter phage RosiePosie]
MTNCIDLIEQHAPDAPKGSFYTCPHGRNYRLKGKGWRPIRNPWTNRKVKQQQWEAIKAELLRVCERAAANHDAKQAEEADKKARADENRARARQHANKIRWGTDAEPGDTVTVEPLREPEGFEVTRVLGRTKHDAKAGDVVELDMDNPPTHELPRKLWDARQEPHGWAKVENSEDYKPRRSDAYLNALDLPDASSLKREDHKARILDAYYANVAAGRRLDTAKGFFTNTVEEYANANRLGFADAVSLLEDAREDERKRNEATGRIAVYKEDGTPKTADEIREEAAKINGRGTTFVDLEGSPNLLTEKPKASGGVISAEHDHFKGSVKIEVHGVRGDAAEVMEQAAASIRENGARGVWL